MNNEAEHDKDFLGRGWAFPVSLTLNSGRVSSVEYESDIEQSIYLILSTAKGERVMRADFGCGIHDVVFAAISSGLIAQVKHSVTQALTKYETRIEVLTVAVDANQALNGKLLIEIDYRVHSTNQSGNFVFPFYFKEAF
ncbi:MAG: GPW/gp25 family protein [Pseudomonadales bacterium]